MNRKEFLKILSIMPILGSVQSLNALADFAAPLKATEQMPVFFFGHGSPMNAIEENEFTKEWNRIGATISRPVAILCISAHWLTKGTYVTAMEQPRTIHDFGGFPKELFDVQYPAQGSPAVAKETQDLFTNITIGLDEEWGLDHGCWERYKTSIP